MELKGKCQHCGQELRMETDKTMSQRLVTMVERYMDKLTVKVLCGNCDKMTVFTQDDSKGEKE